MQPDKSILPEYYKKFIIWLSEQLNTDSIDVTFVDDDILLGVLSAFYAVKSNPSAKDYRKVKVRLGETGGGDRVARFMLPEALLYIGQKEIIVSQKMMDHYNSMREKGAVKVTECLNEADKLFDE